MPLTRDERRKANEIIAFLQTQLEAGVDGIPYWRVALEGNGWFRNSYRVGISVYAAKIPLPLQWTPILRVFIRDDRGEYPTPFTCKVVDVEYRGNARNFFIEKAMRGSEHLIALLEAKFDYVGSV